MNEAAQQLIELFKNCLDDLTGWSIMTPRERIETINLLRNRLSTHQTANQGKELINADYYRVRALNQCVLLCKSRPDYSVLEIRQTLESGLSSLIDY